MRAVLEGALLAGVVERMTRPDFPAFEAQLRSSGYCSRPVRLRGQVEVCDGYGRRRQVWTTDGEPDGLLRKACGNRREAVCGPCAERYRCDTYHLVAAGLRGGEGIPESVTGHPALFATLTAPTFGVVHAHIVGPDGQPLRCHPRRDRPVCRHGVVISCSRVHGPDDPCLGEPLCPDCFDYESAVTWNNLLGELWRRSTIYLPRKLAKLAGITQKRLHEQVRVSYVKVSEYQHRGLVHLHTVIRLDRRMPDHRAADVRPPARRFTSELLGQALRATVKDVKVEIPGELGAGTIRWGQQLDVQQLPA
jgi:replication initiator protein RepSA